MEKKLKVLECIDQFLPEVNGSIRTIYNYSKYLSKSCDVTIATLGKSPAGIKLPFPVVYSEANGLTTQFCNKLRRVKWDIIHIHSPFKLAKFAIHLAKEQNCAIVSTIHTNFVRKYETQGMLGRIKTKQVINTYNQMDELFVPSPYVAEDLKTRGINCKFSYLPLSSDITPAQDIDSLSKYANRQWSIKATDNVLISIGNLRDTKRIGFALQALKLAKDKGFDFKYFVVGEGEMRESLQRLTNYLGLDKNVAFTGYLGDSDLCPLLARSNLLLLPTTYDLFGLAKVEAAAMHTAGLYIKDSYVSNEVFDGINGYTSLNNIEAYSDNILRAFSNRKQLAAVGDTASTELYASWESCTSALLERLTAIAAEHHTLSKKLKSSKGK